MADFSQVKDSTDFVLIPEGTVVEACINKIETKPGKTDSNKTVLHLEFQISKGEYVFQKINDTITIAGMDEESLMWGKGKIKRMLEYGKNASPTNLAGYIVPEVMGSNGKPQVKYSELIGMFVGFQTKLESFTSNKTGENLQSVKVGAYASKNPDSSGYKFWDALQKNEQPWQKALPVNSNKTRTQVGGNLDNPPISAYEGGF